MNRTFYKDRNGFERSLSAPNRLHEIRLWANRYAARTRLTSHLAPSWGCREVETKLQVTEQYDPAVFRIKMGVDRDGQWFACVHNISYEKLLVDHWRLVIASTLRDMRRFIREHADSLKEKNRGK